MNKSILISIRPEWVEKILNGEKTIEIRKTMPKCDFPIDVYIYCTKDNGRDYVTLLPDGKTIYSNDGQFGSWGDDILNGKVVAKFTLNKVNYTTTVVKYGKGYTHERFKKDINIYATLENILPKTCLTEEELINYEHTNHTFGVFAWNIDNLEIFDKPLELHNFATYCDGENDKKCKKCPYYWYESNESIGFEDGCYCNHKPPLSKAPKSWCYVYRKEDK